jgi:ribosomal protein S18 acetylase RimI-like enzyme
VNTGSAERGPGAVGPVVVRRVEAADWAALRSVRLAALADAPQAFGSTAVHEQAFAEAEWHRQASTGLPTFIAWRADEPVGLVTVFHRQQDGDRSPADGSPVEWHLVSMWVSPGMRGTGCASQLVAAAVTTARAESADQLTLWVADGNTRARAFYRRVGFRPTGVRQVYRRRDGSLLHEEKMIMLLGDGG